MNQNMTLGEVGENFKYLAWGIAALFLIGIVWNQSKSR